VAQSVDVIIYGRVEAIQGRNWSDDGFAYTTFNITVLQTVKPSLFNKSSILIHQNGYDYDGKIVEVSGDPLMNMGDRYIFFLDKWRNYDGTVRPEYLRSMGGLGMFLVRDGKVYPQGESWSPSDSGRSFEDILNVINSYLS
jgi:hypothetical protein